MSDPRWQPIETAPKNGDDFLAWSLMLGHLVVAYDEIATGHHCWATLDGPSYLATALTHWMPLPDPPVSS